METQATILDGRYRLMEQVGAGGTAVVYRAIDERLGRTVAVKILRPHLAQDPAYLEKFSQEAQRAAQVSHPNIATVLDVNAQAAQPYMIMEYVDGVALSRLAPLPIADAVEAIRQGADALGFLHRNNLVHGDVKPDNLLVRQDGRVKLVDFGIARPIGTAEGATIMGSPAYVAPERLQGAPLSPTADVYGLGAALFEALAGRPPFIGPTAQAVASQSLSAEPPALPRLRPEIPLAVEGIVARAMAKDPLRRFKDMDQFGVALAGLQMSAGQSTGPIHVTPGLAATGSVIPRAIPAPAPVQADRPTALPPSQPKGPVSYAPPPTRPTPAEAPSDSRFGRTLLILLLLLVLLGLGIFGLTIFRRTLEANRPVGIPTAPIGGVPTLPAVGQASTPTQAPVIAPTATQAPPTQAPPTQAPPTQAPPTQPPATATAPRPSATATTRPATATPISLATPTTVAATATPRPPTTTPVVTLVEVPGVVGMNENDARRVLQTAGLRVGKVDKQDIPGAPRNVVFRQSLPSGQRVPPRTEIDLVVSR